MVGRVDRARAFSHLGRRGEEEKRVEREGKKLIDVFFPLFLFCCDERVVVGVILSSFAALFDSTKKESKQKKKADQVFAPFLPPRHPSPRFSASPQSAMASLRMMSGSMTSTHFCGGPAMAARVSFWWCCKANPSTATTQKCGGDDDSPFLHLSGDSFASIEQGFARISA